MAIDSISDESVFLCVWLKILSVTIFFPVLGIMTDYAGVTLELLVFHSSSITLHCVLGHCMLLS